MNRKRQRERWTSLSKRIDTVVVALCLPFYAVAIPLMRLHRWITLRRRIYVGLEVSHYPRCDVRHDYLVVDLSRLNDNLIGVQQRRYSLSRSGRHVPPYEEAIIFITRELFWFGEPIVRTIDAA